MKKKKLIIVTLFSLIIITSILTLIKVSASDALPYWGCSEKGDNRTWCKDYTEGSFLYNNVLPGGPVFVRNDDTTDEKWLGPYRYPTIYQGRFGGGAETTDNTPFNVSGIGQIRAYAGQPFYHLIGYEPPVTMTDYPFFTSGARNVIETHRLNADTVKKRYGGNPEWVLPNLELYEITKKTKNTNNGGSYGEFYWIQDIAKWSGGYAQNVNDISFDLINGTRLIIVRTSWPDIVSFKETTASPKVNSPIGFNIKGYEYVSLSRKRVTWDLQVTKDGKNVATKTGTFDSTKGIKNPNKTNEYEAGYFDDNSIQWTPTEAGTYSVTVTINDQVRRDATKTISVTVAPPPGTPFLEITPPSASIKKGTNQAFKAFYTNASGVKSEVTTDTTNTTWSSSDTNIATIGAKTGLATGVNVGTAIPISVTHKTLKATAEIEVYSGSPPPPPPPENLPPTVNISGPIEIKAGDPFCISADASDPDGTLETYSWNTPSLIGSVTDDASCGVYYLEEGSYPVTVTVTDDEGATGEDTVYINVLPPTPVASMNVGGTLKENRTVNIDTFSSSPLHFPIDWTKSYFLIEPLDGQSINLVKSRATNVTVSGNQYKITNARNIESLFKLKGHYQVTHYVENTKGLSDTTQQTVTINEDLKPNADFSTVTTIYRDDLTKAQAGTTIRVTDSSYSPDDEIQQRIWTYKYDSNNNGVFEESATTISSANEAYITVPVNQVGRYLIELTVVEKFSQPTLNEFINPSDYRRDDTSDKILENKVVEVKNLAPVAGFDVGKRRTVKLYIGMGDTNYTQSEIETQLNATLRPFLNGNQSNLEYSFVTGNSANLNNNDFYFENSPDLSSYKKGLYRYNWSSKTFYFIEEYATDVKVSPSNIVYYKKLYDSTRTLYFYEPSTGLKGSTGLTEVGNFIPSIKNKMYYVRYSSGYQTELYVYDLTNKVSTKISGIDNQLSPVSSHLTIDPQGNLYFEHGRYIQYYDATTNKVTQLSDIFPSDGNLIGGFAAHPDGSLYVGYHASSYESGIYKYNPLTKTKTRVFDSSGARIPIISISDTGEIFYTQNDNLYRFYSFSAGTYIMFRPTLIPTFTNGRIMATHWNIDTANTRQTYLYSPSGGTTTVNGQFVDGTVVNDGYELQVQSGQYPIVWETGNRLEKLLSLEREGKETFFIDISNSKNEKLDSPSFVNDLVNQTKGVPFIFLGTNVNKTQSNTFLGVKEDGIFIDNTILSSAVQQIGDYIISSREEKIYLDILLNNSPYSVSQLTSAINTYALPKLNETGIKLKLTVETGELLTDQKWTTIKSSSVLTGYESSSGDVNFVSSIYQNGTNISNVYTAPFPGNAFYIERDILDFNNYDYRFSIIDTNGNIRQSINIAYTNKGGWYVENFGYITYYTGEKLVVEQKSKKVVYPYKFENKGKYSFNAVVKSNAFNSGELSYMNTQLKGINSSLIGLGTSSNKTQFEGIIASLNSGTYIDSANLQLAVQGMADYIIQEIQKKSGQNEIYLTLEENAEYFTYYVDAEKDPKYAERWRYDQNPSIFENDMGYESFNLRNLDTPITQFTKVGRFQTIHAARDNPIWFNDERFDNYRLWSKEVDNWYIYVHRKPIPNFQFTINGTTGDYTITNTSYDLDKQSINIGFGPGLQSSKWQWREKGKAAWQDGLPTSPLARKEYEVKITVKDFQYREESIIKILDATGVNKAPIADFEPIPVKAFINDTISYKNYSYDPNGDPLTYEWSWKLSSSSTWVNGTPTLSTEVSKEPNTKFGAKGIYDVRLRVKDSFNSYSGYVVKQVDIMNRPPKAAFTYSPTTIYNNTNVSFTNTSTDPDNDVLTHKWEFMMPGSSTWTLFSSSQTPTTRTFTTKGDWRIRLTVSDGSQSADTEQILTVGNRAPVANFTYSPTTNLYRGTNITLTDSSTDPDGAADIIRHLWEVQYAGDTNWTSIGTTLNSNLISSKVGNVTVRKTVEDKSGKVSSATKIITISNRAPSVVINHLPSTMINTETTVHFTAVGSDPDTGDSSLLTYKWYFKSPNQTSFVEYRYTDKTIQRKLPTLGNWEVKVVVTDPYGATGESSKTINVIITNQPPVAGFNYTSPIYVGDSIVLESIATDPDNDVLTYKYVVKNPKGEMFTFNTGDSKINNLGNLTLKTNDGEQGVWKITQYVSDSKEEDEVSANITVMDLVIRGTVNHTSDWEKIHLELNSPPNQFFSGEKFLVEALVTNHPIEFVNLDFKGIQTNNDELIIGKTLEPFHPLYSGEIFDKKMSESSTKLKNGDAYFLFTAKWKNGITRQHLVTVQIKDDVYKSYQLYRSN
jgi:hypothetical protein